VRFQHDGAMHSAVRITGPHHNYLALTFCSSESDPAPPQVIELPEQGGCVHPPLNPMKVLDAVLAGVEEANRLHGLSFTVQSVQFVKNDTGPEDVYRFMAQAIVEETKRHVEAERLNFEKRFSSPSMRIPNRDASQ